VNALFALALLASPLRAGVVMSVESGVASAGPAAPVAPISAPAGGLVGAPSLGGLDLRGALPLLPSPVPGLVGPALNFVGFAPEAAPVKPEAGAAQVTPAPAAARGRRADQTPALPAKPSLGSPALAISRDRRTAASTPENGASSSRGVRDEAASKPLVETTSLENARPEKAAGLGRKFFDQGSDENRGELSDRTETKNADGQDGQSVIAHRGGGAAFGGGYGNGMNGNGLEASNTGAAFGGEAGTSRTNLEHMRDAVASVPGAAAPRGAVSFFRSASPNGELSASAGAAGAAVLGFPRPLSLDLSGSGLIVRVRAALGVAAAPEPAAALAGRLDSPGPSTALLERGGLLEAFSVAQVYAESAPGLQTPAVRAASSAALLTPVAEPASAPLWWALFLLPLFAAAIRGIL